jgi:hypothetical protein
MRGAIPPLHNTYSRRNTELKTEINLSHCSDWIDNCDESRSVVRMSNLALCFVQRQGYAVQNSL